MNYKFCILSAGKGTRNTIIDGLHKSLLPLENKAVISYIIDKIPKSVDIVIAVGYKSEQIKTYLKLTHSNRKITFIDVPNYDGVGSGPGLSLLYCKEYLQCPFIFTSSDTLIDEDYYIDNFRENWIGVSNIIENHYESYCLADGNEYLNKLYYGHGNVVFIGVAGIYEYSKFWDSLSNTTLIKHEHQVINGFNNLEKVKLKYFGWNDTGNNQSYLKTKNKFTNEIVASKNNECLFIEGGLVIKYFSESKKIDNLLNRLPYLNNTCPTTNKLNDNMYYYNFVDGDVLSNITDVNVLQEILPFWYKNLSSIKYNKDTNFLKNCKYMYYEKTYDRCEYFSDNPIDDINYINGIKVEKINNILNQVNWESIYSLSIPTKFHGDFQPENILYDPINKKFILIDWRQSFGESIEIGDLYYDIGKLYHALFINGNDINNKLYKLEIIENKANIFYYSRNNLLFLLDELKKFCSNNGYSWYNVKLLATLQYLGISSLYNNFHDGNYGKFLFLYGKYLLTKLLQEK